MPGRAPKELRSCFENRPRAPFQNWHGACFVHFHKKPIALDAVPKERRNGGKQDRFDTPIAIAVGAAAPCQTPRNLCPDPLERPDHESRLDAQPFVMPLAFSLAVLCRFMPGSRDPRLKPGGGL